MEKVEKVTKDIKVTFDEVSLDILKKVDPIHRQSMINYAIRLVDETPVYKVLSGEIAVAPELVQSQESPTEDETEPEVEPKKEEESFVDMSDFNF